MAQDAKRRTTARTAGSGRSAARTAGSGRTSAERPVSGPEPKPQQHVCTVSFCPICLAVTSVQPLRPEAVEHLLVAGRELLLAFGSLLGARAEDVDWAARERGATLTRIDIQ
jgi:hypothetical protein